MSVICNTCVFLDWSELGRHPTALLCQHTTDVQARIRIRYLTLIQLVSLKLLLSSSQLVLAVGGWSELII